MTHRTYRTRMARSGLVSFQVRMRETDLMILAERNLSDAAMMVVMQQRRQLEHYIAQHPGFLETLIPWPPDVLAPSLVQAMIRATAQVNVGPMAAVAGAIADAVGQELLTRSQEVIVENGGDIFLKITGPATMALFAGRSPLSLKVGIRLQPEQTPLGVCTSSGTVGHSLSLGRADAACVLASTAILADAAATALGNRVKESKDIPAALEWLGDIPDVWGGIVIVGEKLGAWGEVELTPL
ncbi:UPF0280 family protein [Desulfobacca acetoxidans]|uniref:ApbE family lipoprotein n=1 Tax=Desulfobacca acetoxidans (strain ATCC 700848 / DSM 11109 / ASRB2) TaxID=880072 RepID=F2NJV4_DESAR|nr:UPF0280 family protein [Desulfobacca acetoxidans]AEB09898.1 ApbE family lipoprotein [Desulfobacca acetoxidans DSM 11109]